MSRHGIRKYMVILQSASPNLNGACGKGLTSADPLSSQVFIYPSIDFSSQCSCLLFFLRFSSYYSFSVHHHLGLQVSKLFKRRKASLAQILRKPILPSTLSKILCQTPRTLLSFVPMLFHRILIIHPKSRTTAQAFLL